MDLLSENTLDPDYKKTENDKQQMVVKKEKGNNIPKLSLRKYHYNSLSYR